MDPLEEGVNDVAKLHNGFSTQKRAQRLLRKLKVNTGQMKAEQNHQ